MGYEVARTQTHIYVDVWTVKNMYICISYMFVYVLYIYMRILSYIYVNTYRHISNNMISWCVQTWNSPKYSDFDEKNISFQTKIQGFFPTAESMADAVYSSNIYQISLSSLVPCFFLHLYGDLYDWCGFICLHMDFASQNQPMKLPKKSLPRLINASESTSSTAFKARTCSSVGLRHGPTLRTW